MARRVLDEVWRAHWGRLLGQLIRRFGRPDLVEDALAEAFAEAAAAWPATGVPDNPVGWLRTVAHRRLVDALRRERTARTKAHLLADDDGGPGVDDVWEPPGADVDERLPLLFMATHPALAADVRPALALRFVLGVPTADVARLFLVPPATMAARLTRAKARLAGSGIPFVVPDPASWPDRLDDVARAIYLAFTAGYAPGGGDDVVRVREAGEAVRLAELATDLLPGQAVLEALAALLRLQHARRHARARSGRPVLLAEQDRSRWRSDEIDAGLQRLAALPPTRGLAEELRLQALVAAFHDTAPSYGQTDWAAIARTYARLEELTGSAVVRLNRAVAVGEASGPMAGLAVLRAALDQLPGHHRVALVRAELLRRDGQLALAATAYADAITACPDGAERQHIIDRRESLTGR